MASVYVSNGEFVPSSDSLKTSSFMYRKKAAARAESEVNNEFINLLHGSDPVRVELNRLENELRGTRFSLSLSLINTLGRYYCLSK